MSVAQSVSSSHVFHHQHVHLVGIGGYGMSALVPLLEAVGAMVSGCDLVANANVVALRRRGVPVAIGHDPQHLRGDDEAQGFGPVTVLVTSAAIPKDHPELQAARDAGVRVFGRAACLAALIGQRRNIAVTGAHGKTSTTWLTGHLLRAADRNPTVMVGGSVENLNESGGVAGGGPVVAEADESDGSFVHFSPQVVVLTNVDREHLDYYGSFQHLLDAFADWFARAGPAATLILGDASAPASLLRQWPGHILRVDQPGAAIQACDVQLGTQSSQARLLVHGEDRGRFRVPTPGRHMVTNSLLALTAAQVMTGHWLVEHVQSAGRVRRRFGDHGRFNGVRLIDDYAHHPREIAAVVATARLGLRHGGRLLCLFQPHRYSRTKECLADFQTCFQGAAIVAVTATYAAGELPLPGFGGRAIAAAIETKPGLEAVQYVSRPEDGAAFVAGQARVGDSILVLGAGNVNAVLPQIKRALEFRAPATSNNSLNGHAELRDTQEALQSKDVLVESAHG
jgi:UDP-N-acetylmuramate--alanine ligase